ncbi:DUF934 domain-containing protein [Roseovarius amoyensis]|uniref:DUF934 domain-containing protein n=1 Tax=Roseovarius amoyensis TaxID=2211448 RepID=UPI000DBE0E0A|nr:DUF934 domain-containing protein [Roseovarius amoyensis]
MSVIVTDTGFAPDDWQGGFTPLAEAGPEPTALDLPDDTDPLTLADRLANVAMIRVDFPVFSNGRGFSIARELRLMGYAGRLRARGHVISDQYAMARRSGFDEVEISDNLAARQPEQDWLFRAEWQNFDYQARLRG